jgi:hypothetical protein
MANRFLNNIRINDAYTFPASDGTSGQIITTDGSGVLSFADPAAVDGSTIILSVKNVSGGSLSKGTVVHVSPSVSPPSGNILEVIAADNTSASTMPAVGVLNSTLADAAEGEAVAFGALSGIDTSSFTAGDEVFVGTSGGLTTTKPTGTSYIQKIAVVVKSHATTGSIEIFGAGRTNDVPAPLYVDVPNSRVGIGETSPGVSLDIGTTDAVQMPAGTTAQRPGTPAAGMFRYNTTDGQFEGYTTDWGAIAGSGGGGGGSSTIYRETFSGNGSATSFTLSTAISDEANTQVYIDGVYQSKLNYSTSGTSLTFTTAPPTGTNNIEVVHIAAVTVSSTSGLIQNSFTGDGSTVGFTLSITPTDENFTFVFIQGVYQDKSTYTVSGNTITFSTAPQNGYSVEVMSIGAVNIQQASYLEYDNFTGDGSTTNYTLLNGSPSDEKFTMVYIQGVYQEKSTYSLSAGDIIFSTAPQSGYTIEIISVNGGGIQAAQSYTPTQTVETKVNVEVISTNTTAAGHNYLYVFTASLTLTLPASPEVGDSIKISNRSGTTTCVLGRNGNNIMGSASDLTLDTASASFELIYSGATQGWVIIGQ